MSNAGVDSHAAALRRKTYASSHAFRRNGCVSGSSDLLAINYLVNPSTLTAP